MDSAAEDEEMGLDEVAGCLNAAAERASEVSEHLQKALKVF